MPIELTTVRAVHAAAAGVQGHLERARVFISGLQVIILTTVRVQGSSCVADNPRSKVAGPLDCLVPLDVFTSVLTIKWYVLSSLGVE